MIDNVTSLGRRIAKLEGSKQIAAQGERTFDELNIEILDVQRLIASHPDTPDARREECLAGVAEIEADIRAMARKQAEAGYADHLAYVAKAWGGVEKYVPALTGANSGMAEYDGREFPDLMERRANLRARPDIARLIGQMMI